MSLKTPGSMKTVVRIIHNHSNLLYFSVVPRYTCTVWRIPCFSANSWRVWFTHSLSGCLGAVLSLDPRCCFFSFKAHVCPSDWGLFLCYFHQTISTHGFNFTFFSPIAKLCRWEFFYLEVVNSLAIFRLGGRALAWKNSRHCSTPPLVSPRNNVWEESAEISHRLRVTTQNRDSDASSEWNNNYFYARFSYVISLGNEQWRREMLVDFSG